MINTAHTIWTQTREMHTQQSTGKDPNDRKPHNRTAENGKRKLKSTEKSEPGDVLV
jgi:hypothetical protein